MNLAISSIIDILNGPYPPLPTHTQRSELMPGDIYPCPHNVAHVPDRDRLGKGGNGTVVKFSLGGKEYALKQVWWGYTMCI